MNISSKRRKTTTPMTRVKTPLMSQKIVLEPRKYLEAIKRSWEQYDPQGSYCIHCNAPYDRDDYDYIHKLDCIVLEAQALYNLLNKPEGGIL